MKVHTYAVKRVVLTKIDSHRKPFKICIKFSHFRQNKASPFRFYTRCNLFKYGPSKAPTSVKKRRKTHLGKADLQGVFNV